MLLIEGYAKIFFLYILFNWIFFYSLSLSLSLTLSLSLSLSLSLAVKISFFLFPVLKKIALVFLLALGYLKRQGSFLAFIWLGHPGKKNSRFTVNGIFIICQLFLHKAKEVTSVRLFMLKAGDCFP